MLVETGGFQTGVLWDPGGLCPATGRGNHRKIKALLTRASRVWLFFQTCFVHSVLRRTCEDRVPACERSVNAVI